MKKILLLFVSIFVFSCANADTLLEEGVVIRDAEIEDILKSYIDPLFEKAHLNKKDLNLVLLVNKEVNAAASINTTLILNSGFLLRTTNLDEVIGVLAHEVGHLEGRHIIRMLDAMDQAQKRGMLSVAVGIALGLLTQRPDLGAAIAVGSNISNIYALLSYNRSEEASADQAAVRYLNELCWPADGLATFFEKLLGQELLSSSLQDPYVRSHPLTKDRLNAVREQIKSSCQRPFPRKMLENYKVLKIKLEAFLMPPAYVLSRNSGTTALAQYAQAIAYYRQGKLNPSIKLLDSLLSKNPKNSYYHELKGQIFYESGKLKPSIQSYRAALSLKPDDVLFQIGLAQSLISINTKPSLEEAEKLLEKAQKKEPQNITIWQLLSMSYGRLKKMGAMALSLAEKAALLNKWDEADEQVIRALHYLKKNDYLYLRAQDLQIQTKREKSKATQTPRL